jgi:23S rRNA-/tRNA-specific pseudouridylate synthase
MEKQYQVVEEKGANQRLDKALCLLFDISRNRAKELIDEEAVLVNGIGTKPSYKVQTGDEIELLMPPLEKVEIKPENIPLDIVYEDEDVLVVNKPRGMVVHPSPGHYSGTLVNALMYHIKDLSGINGVMRPGIVHRIDKDTSGLLIVCKNDNAHTQISKQLSEKECKREYKAIVHHPFSHTFGTIDAPIGRDEKNRQKMQSRILRSWKILKTMPIFYASSKREGPTRSVSIWNISNIRSSAIQNMDIVKRFRLMDSFFTPMRLNSRTQRQARECALKKSRLRFFKTCSIKWKQERSNEGQGRCIDMGSILYEYGSSKRDAKQRSKHASGRMYRQSSKKSRWLRVQWIPDGVQRHEVFLGEGRRFSRNEVSVCRSCRTQRDPQ